MIGEPETNPTDFTGAFRMGCGEAIEKMIRDKWLAQLGPQGLYLLASQVPVGHSNPEWDGYVDFLLGYKEEGKIKHIVCEFKTAWGYGADLLWEKPEEIDHDNYFYQLGLYLKDFYDKGKPCEGILLFALISDKNFGKLLQYNCRYNPNTNSVECHQFGRSGSSYPVKLHFPIDAVFKKWNEISESVKNKACPDGEFKYKYPVTQASVEGLSDYRIKRVINEGVIIGDWQVQYSRYKDKILEIDGEDKVYTPEELQVFIDEYKKRHPKSRVSV